MKKNLTNFKQVIHLKISFFFCFAMNKKTNAKKIKFHGKFAYCLSPEVGNKQ